MAHVVAHAILVVVPDYLARSEMRFLLRYQTRAFFSRLRTHRFDWSFRYLYWVISRNKVETVVGFEMGLFFRARCGWFITRCPVGGLICIGLQLVSNVSAGLVISCVCSYRGWWGTARFRRFFRSRIFASPKKPIVLLWCSEKERIWWVVVFRFLMDNSNSTTVENWMDLSRFLRKKFNMWFGEIESFCVRFLFGKLIGIGNENYGFMFNPSNL